MYISTDKYMYGYKSICLYRYVNMYVYICDIYMYILRVGARGAIELAIHLFHRVDYSHIGYNAGLWGESCGRGKDGGGGDMQGEWKVKKEAARKGC